MLIIALELIVVMGMETKNQLLAREPVGLTSPIYLADTQLEPNIAQLPKTSLQNSLSSNSEQTYHTIKVRQV